MAQLTVEGATKRVVQDLPEHEKISYSFSESRWCTESTCQELIEWLGAWLRQQGFLQWVLLWGCASVHRKAFLMEWVRAAHPELRTSWLHSGVAAGRHLDPAASEAQHQTADNAILCRVCVSGRGGAGPVPQHHEACHGALGSAQRWKTQERHNESLAPGLRREPLTRTSMAHSSMRRRWNKKSHLKKRTSFSMMTTTMTTMTMLRIPSTGTAVAEAVVSSSTGASQVERAERFLNLRCAYGKHPPIP